jgi:hypothetical protein
VSARIPDFKIIAARQRSRLSSEDVQGFFQRGRAFGHLAKTLDEGGALLFPHVGIAAGGHQMAAVVDAILDSKAERVIALGVLHAQTEELEQARVRVAEGGDPAHEASWGLQGPGLNGREDWKQEFSLDHFLFLWQERGKRHSGPVPELIIRFPYLAGGHPERLPGIPELERLTKEGRCAIVATGDLFHHGIAYGNSPDMSRTPEAGGLDLARSAIDRGLEILRGGDYSAYNRHSVETKSDARDVGQVLRHLIGPFEGRVLDLVAEDMTGPYEKPPPSWVAGALVRFSTSG